MVGGGGRRWWSEVAVEGAAGGGAGEGGVVLVALYDGVRVRANIAPLRRVLSTLSFSTRLLLVQVRDPSPRRLLQFISLRVRMRARVSLMNISGAAVL
jgi:hypothetical protein